MDALTKILAEMERQAQARLGTPAPAPEVPVVQQRRKRKREVVEPAPGVFEPAEARLPVLPDAYTEVAAAPPPSTAGWSRQRMTDALTLMSALGPPPALLDWDDD